MSFDISAAKSNDNFSVIPVGKYNCTVSDATVKDTKNGTGEYIQATFMICDGEYKGRKIFANFNIKNENPKAVEIGMGQLKSMAENIPDMTMKFETPFEFCTAVVGKTVGVKTKIRSDETHGDKAEAHYFFKARTTPPADDQIAF